MKKIIFIIMINLLYVSLYGQENHSIDSLDMDEEYINLEDLKLEDDQFEPDNFNYKMTWGWFPVSKISDFNFNLSIDLGDIYDYARTIQSKSFSNTGLPYSHSNPMSRDERKLSIKYKNLVNEEDDFPATGFNSYGFEFKFTFPFWIMLRSNLSVDVADGLLFTEKMEKNFLDFSGNLQSFKEVGIIYHEEVLLNWGLGFIFPIYGVLIQEDITAYSFYYIYSGISASYTLSSKGTQYAQIANAKDIIRYNNGLDTINLKSNTSFSELNRFRYYLDIGIGWDFEASKVGLKYELFFSVPLSSVLKDTEWNQYKVGLNLSLYLQWLFNL